MKTTLRLPSAECYKYKYIGIIKAKINASFFLEMSVRCVLHELLGLQSKVYLRQGHQGLNTFAGNYDPPSFKVLAFRGGGLWGLIPPSASVKFMIFIFFSAPTGAKPTQARN